MCVIQTMNWNTVKVTLVLLCLQSRCVQMLYLLMTTPWHRNFYFLRPLQSHMTLTLNLFQIYEIVMSYVYELDACRFNNY